MPLIEATDGHRWRDASRIAGLERRVPSRSPWGLVKTLVLGLATAGVLPLLRWPMVWAQQRRAEAFRLARAADVEPHRPLAAPALRAVATLAAGAAGGLLIFALVRGELLDTLVGRGGLSAGYAAVMLVGCAAVYADLVRHRRAVRRLTPGVRLSVLPPPRLRFAFAALACVTLPVFWFTPVLLLGGALRHHTLVTTPRVFAETARRSRAAADGPLLEPAGRRVCRTRRCNTPVADGARFCTRCGREVPS